MQVAELVVLALAAAPLFAQEPPGFVPDKPPFSVRVSVRVTGYGPYEGQFMSCLNRELRAIHGVVVTEQNPAVLVAVIMVETKSGGIPTGFATAVMIHEATLPPDLTLQLGPDLASVCRIAAADIEKDAIEPAREAWQIRQDLTPDVFLAHHQ